MLTDKEMKIENNDMDLDLLEDYEYDGESILDKGYYICIPYTCFY